MVHSSLAQTTMTISGQVFDRDTKEPISFAALGLAPTVVGEISDANCFF